MSWVGCNRQPGDGQGTKATTEEIPVGWPEEPASAFHGLAGEVVRVIEPHSEADPAALLIQFLKAFGNIIGPSAHYHVEDTPHHTNLFAVVVGETAKSRKGTSWGRIRNLFGELEPDWVQRRIKAGLSTGEGLIWCVRDPTAKRTKPGKKRGKLPIESTDVDKGVADKRLLVVEEEFSSTLRVMERKGATLSAVLRDAWDTGNLSSLTKNSPGRASGAHISILGHITRQELKRYLTETEYANGFGNRFLWVCAKRSKCLPQGGALDKKALRPLVARLQKAISFGRKAGEMRRDEKARRTWAEIYPELSEGMPGLLGSITSRAEAQVLRLSMIYALLDCSQTIRVEHQKAALAVWNYSMASARYIFGDALGLPEADEILRALRETPQGLTRTKVSALFGRHRSAGQIDNALATLKERGLVEMRQIQTDGRYAEAWHAILPSAK